MTRDFADLFVDRKKARWNDERHLGQEMIDFHSIHDSKVVSGSEWKSNGEIMAVPVTIPKFTISMEGGTILRWLKVEGDAVSRDEPLLEMETDKVDVELSAPSDGILLRIIVSQGPVKVGDVVGWIGGPGEPAGISR